MQIFPKWLCSIKATPALEANNKASFPSWVVSVETNAGSLLTSVITLLSPSATMHAGHLLALPNELFSLICYFLDDAFCINALHQTCRRLYLFLGPTLYRHDAQSDAPYSLEWAAIHGVQATAKYALDAGISPTATCFEEWVPIALACRHGHGPIVRLMLDKGVDPNSDHEHWGKPNRLDWSYGIYKDPNTSLVAHAARNGHLIVCKTLIEYGANHGVGETWIVANTLLIAGKKGHLSVVKFLYETACNDFDHEKHESVAYKCLGCAAEPGHIEIVRYFLENTVRASEQHHYLMGNGFRVNEHLRSYERALKLASAAGHLDIVQLLLSTCYVETPPTQTLILDALEAAARGPHLTVVDLLRNILDIDDIIFYGKNRDYNQLFSTSALCGWVDLVQRLLEKGCSPDAILSTAPYSTAEYRWTALAMAAKTGHIEMVNALLDYGSDVDKTIIRSRPVYCETPPIVYAAENGHKAIVERLLKHGANIKLTRKVTRKSKRISAFHDVRCPEIMGLLLDWGVDPSIPWFKVQDEGWSPGNFISLLPGMVKNGSVEMLKMLLARNMPLELPPPEIPAGFENLRENIQLHTLFTLAAQNGVSMVEFLLEKGYKIEPGSSEVSMGFGHALSRADLPLVNLFLDRKLLGDLAEAPYKSILGSVMLTEGDIEAAETIIDALLAHGFEIRDDLRFIRERHDSSSYIGPRHLCYENPRRAAISQLLLDRGANPIAGPGPETELSVAALTGDQKGVRIMLKYIEQVDMTQEEMHQKLAFAEEQAKSQFEINQDIVRAIQRAHWRLVYPVSPTKKNISTSI